MHDNAIHLLVTTGFAGLAAWLILMLYIFIRQIKIYRRTRGNDTLNSLALASLISMIAFQIAGVFDWNYGDFAFSFVLWIFISLAFLAEKFNMDIQKA
jgi:O-antigen ligase